MHEFKHPNYYKKLKASQEKKAISPDESTDSDGRAPGSSNKQQAGEAQASSYKDSSSK